MSTVQSTPMHGPTFLGNALACRLALQSIALFEEQDYLAKIRRMEQITRRELAGFSPSEHSGDPHHGRLCLHRGV